MSPEVIRNFAGKGCKSLLEILLFHSMTCNACVCRVAAEDCDYVEQQANQVQTFLVLLKQTIILVITVISEAIHRNNNFHH